MMNLPGYIHRAAANWQVGLELIGAGFSLGCVSPACSRRVQAFACVIEL